MGVGKKWVSLSGSITMNLFPLSLSLLFVTQPKISLRQSPSCLRERWVSAVDKDMFTWVLSAYKWWSNLWLWIRELSSVVYRVNSNGLWMEPWGKPQNMGTASEKQFLNFIDWDLFFKEWVSESGAHFAIPIREAI